MVCVSQQSHLLNSGCGALEGIMIKHRLLIALEAQSIDWLIHLDVLSSGLSQGCDHFGVLGQECVQVLELGLVAILSALDMTHVQEADWTDENGLGDNVESALGELEVIEWLVGGDGECLISGDGWHDVMVWKVPKLDLIENEFVL